MFARHKIFFRGDISNLQKQFKFSISIAKLTILNLHAWIGVLAITQIYKAALLATMGDAARLYAGRWKKDFTRQDCCMLDMKLDVSASTHSVRKRSAT